MFDSFVTNCLESIFQVTMNLGFPSYAIAIMVIAVVIRMALLPLNMNQLRSSIAMQQIQPQLKEIQEKYANNPELMNQKTMQLYQDYEINPMAGCLPLLIQFPILIGLYQGLSSFVPQYSEYYKFLWIPDLSQVDTTYIMVLLVGASTALQSLIVTGKPTQTMQWYMVVAMPLMMGWMAAKFPAFLCIYWLSITVVGIFQQLVITKPVKKRMEKRQAELAEERRQKIEERNSANAMAKANRAARRAEKNNKSIEEIEADGEKKPREHKKNRRRSR